MATSGTYNFANITAQSLIKEAFERCGIIQPALSALQQDSGRTSLNYLFVDWVSKNLQLWAIEKCMMPIYGGQSQYNLPDATVNIAELTAAYTTRQVSPGGVPYTSAGGNAAYAFDGNPLTACIQTAPNGFISYDYGLGNDISIFYVGIQSNVTTTYTLQIDYSYGVGSSSSGWINALTTPPTIYQAGLIQYWVPPTPVNAQSWRIIETGGNTLNIQEIYFNTPNNSILMQPMSRAEYIAIPNKSQTGTPAMFYLDRTNPPTLNLWPTPVNLTNSFNSLIYNRKRQLQDVGNLYNQLDAPQWVFEAIAANLAARLAVKWAPDRYAMLAALALEAYNAMELEDTEPVPVRFTPQFDQFT